MSRSSDNKPAAILLQFGVIVSCPTVYESHHGPR